jgi:tetratricopeptide (TPR) repeat protein
MEEVAQAYRHALEPDPNYTPALFKLGLLELDSGNSEQGTDFLIRATKADTAMAVFVAGECSKRAAAFKESGNLDAALHLYTAALQVYPVDLWPQVYLGEIYESQGKNDAAREAYKKVLLQKPESPVSAQKLQDLLVRMQVPPETILAEWQVLSDAHPEAVVPLKYLGMAPESLRRLDEARAAYKKSLNQNPEVDQGACRLAALEVLAGNIDQGLTEMREFVRNHPDQTSSISNRLGELAETFMGQGKTEEAVRLYKTALELSPTDLWPQVHLGEIYETQGRYENALDAYRSVLTQKPESPVSARKLQDLLVKMQTPPETVLGMWRAISEQHPEAAVPLYYLGMALEAAGDLKGAEEAVRRSMEINPDIAATAPLRDAATGPHASEAPKNR